MFKLMKTDEDGTEMKFSTVGLMRSPECTRQGFSEHARDNERSPRLPKMHGQGKTDS